MSSSSSSSSSNIFQQVMTSNPSGLLGPSYNYSSKILTPENIGVSSDGTIGALTNDINGLIQYTEVLVTGKGASTTGRPLGDKFFMTTGQKCKDTATGEQVVRSIYIDNVPDGSIPFISSAMGVKFSAFEGLIPGTISDLDVLNPYTMLQSFMSGSVPDCKAVTLETVDVNDNKGQQTAYMTLVDIQNMEGFQNQDSYAHATESYSQTTHGSVFRQDTVFRKDALESKNDNKKKEKIRNKMFHDPSHFSIFFLFLSVLGVYLLYVIMKQHH
jgi:hypothetical protein